MKNSSTFPRAYFTINILYITFYLDVSYHIQITKKDISSICKFKNLTCFRIEFINPTKLIMKRILYTLLFVATVLTVNAQDNKWNIGFGGGFASPQGDLKNIVDGGVDGYLNCTYNFTSKLAAGLEYNSSSFVGISELGTSIDATKINAILLKGVYYMTETKVRPYAALMTGMYMSKFGVLGTNDNGDLASEYISKNKFGGGFELGLKIKWFNLGVAYNNLGKVEDGKISYMQYNLGFNIGF
jgi:hypothetical protein